MEGGQTGTPGVSKCHTCQAETDWASPRRICNSEVPGDQAVWTGISYYNHVGDHSPPAGYYQTKFTITVTGLGSSPWVLGSSEGRPDASALANVTAASGFTANLLFEVNTGSGYVPMDTLPNNGGYTQEQFYGGFYLAPVPEPSTVIAGALLLLPFGMSTIRRLRRKA